MAEETKTQEQQQQAPKQASHCSGDCMQCFPAQRMLCASQMSLYNMKMLAGMEQELVILKNITRRLDEKLQAIQDNEATLFEPARPELKAQEG